MRESHSFKHKTTMASLLKNVYSTSFYKTLGDTFSELLPGFKSTAFMKKIYSEDFESKELKQRMRHTSEILHEFFPDDYKETVALLKQAINLIREKGVSDDGLAYMCFPDYVEVYGLNDYETSIDAIEYITQFVSCEFAVRPFLIKYGERMISQMLLWSKHENSKVRRLASEGSRPRLPWAMAVPVLKKEPKQIIPILENLKNDASESVRRSVANSLNDIAKDHPDVVIRIAQKWSGKSKETDAVIKHGSRTLLKQGHTKILRHFGLKSDAIHLSDFKLKSTKVQIGNVLEFDFSITNGNATSQKVRLEYAIYYRLQNGNLSRKVFKISERDYLAHAIENINRKHKFILITTRTFYTGAHRLGIIVNGEEKAVSDFELLNGILD